MLDKNQVEYQAIDQVNWEKFSYKPEVKFRIAHTGKEVLLHYKVTEQSVRAMAGSDNGPVWEDACVEFLFRQQETVAITILNATVRVSCLYKVDQRETGRWLEKKSWQR